MKILYVAKHGQSNSNDDEGAITHALNRLGHDVQLFNESEGYRVVGTRGDLLLFHKWTTDAVRILKLMKGSMPRVFWYFDLVDFLDPTLASRCQTRKAWMGDILPNVELGFCTDGDWVVASPHASRLIWLPQGADERVIGRGVVKDPLFSIDILFTGGKKGGRARESFVDELTCTYGPQVFTHIEKGVHRRRMANLITCSKVVVAPDGPVTDRYWSNRVYNALGFGAFMIHPYCRMLADQYLDGKEILYYRDRVELHQMIHQALLSPDLRKTISEGGLQKTIQEHTYTHRCAQLIQTVQERLSGTREVV